MRSALLRSVFICLILASLPMVFTACGNPRLEEAEKQLIEKRIVNTSDIQLACQLARFNIATPAFVPDGFSFGRVPFSVELRANSPTPNKTINPDLISVTTTWWDQSKENYIMLQQSKYKMGISSKAETTTINGKPGLRLLDRNNMLMLAWEHDQRYYILSTKLTDTLDEATMMKMANSLVISIPANN